MKYYIIFEFHSKKTFLFLGGFRNRLLGTNHSVFIYIYAEKSENIAIRMFFKNRKGALFKFNSMEKKKQVIVKPME